MDHYLDMTTPILERDQKFFEELEEVLDEYFPKVEEEGEEKRLMKRGEALMLFSAANEIHSRLLLSQRQSLIEKVEGMKRKPYYDARSMKDEHNQAIDDVLSILKETI